VRLGDRDAYRTEYDDRGDQADRNGDRSTRPAPLRRGRPLAAMPPGDRDRQADQHGPCAGREHTGHVAGRRPIERDVPHVEQAVDEREGPEAEAERCAQPRPQPRERHDAGDAGADRDHRSERVLAQADTSLAVHERVVERVHDHQRRGDDEDERLAGAVSRHRSSAS
jgi:hypothetical protein